MPSSIISIISFFNPFHIFQVILKNGIFHVHKSCNCTTLDSKFPSFSFHFQWGIEKYWFSFHLGNLVMTFLCFSCHFYRSLFAFLSFPSLLFFLNIIIEVEKGHNISLESRGGNKRINYLNILMYEVVVDIIRLSIKHIFLDLELVLSFQGDIKWRGDFGSLETVFH